MVRMPLEITEDRKSSSSMSQYELVVAGPDDNLAASAAYHLVRHAGIENDQSSCSIANVFVSPVLDSYQSFVVHSTTDFFAVSDRT